jgi:hypothetical protein
MLSAGERTQRAKRFNEGVTLTATVFDATAIRTRGTGFLTPPVQHPMDVLARSGWSSRWQPSSGIPSARSRFVFSCGRGTGDMPQTCAFQILALAVAVSALGLGGLSVAARIHDRTTRRLDLRRSD